jgi:hypothetical protein
MALGSSVHVFRDHAVSLLIRTALFLVLLFLFVRVAFVLANWNNQSYPGCVSIYPINQVDPHTCEPINAAEPPAY